MDPSNGLGRRRVQYEAMGLYFSLASLIVCCIIGVFSAWNWPLTGDESLIHYVVLMLHTARAPYAQIVEINLPGTYLLDYLAMNSFGWGAHGLRLYDGFLCVTLCSCAYLLGQRSRRESLVCLAGGLVFVLIHLQDGFDQAGQRDFALAVLVLFGLNILIRCANHRAMSFLLYELIVGFTLTIKPTLAPLALLPLLVDWNLNSHSSRDTVKLTLAAILGLGTPWLVAILWLRHFHAVYAFVAVMRSIGALHSHLGRKSFFYLLTHSTSPVIVLFVLGIMTLCTMPPRLNTRDKLLAGSALCGLISYIEQGKGFPYQRYPFLATSLILIFLTFSKASLPHRFAYVLSLLGMCYGSLWLAPQCIRTVRSFDTIAPFQKALADDLHGLKHGQTVQCVDTYGGCLTTLYNLRIPQATGYLYDCYLFGKESDTRDAYRRGFLQAFLTARPSAVVLTNERCFDPARSFDRIKEWPEFSAILSRDYKVTSTWQTEKIFRSWSHGQVPNSYKLYVLKDE